MESIETKMNEGSKDSLNFFKHVFDFNETNKDLMMNLVQYGFLTIIPIILVLRVIKNWFPEENSLKGSPSILAEVVGEILFIFASLWFIHKIVTFIPTYSGKQYEEINYTNILLPFLFILLTIQTKLGAKINILVSRLSRRLGFKNVEGMTDESDDDPKKKPKHQASKSDYLDTNTVMPGTPPRNIPNFNEMYGGPTTPLQQAEMPGQGQSGGQPNGQVPGQMAAPEPMAANDALGGSFGSAW